MRKYSKLPVLELTMKKLPIGIQTFSIIRNAGEYCYVDKTPLIYKLANGSGAYFFLARPRRFGKSLLISTLAAAFSGQKTLFDGLFLADNWDWDTVYPVIHISLGAGVYESRTILDETLVSVMTNCASDYQIKLTEKNTSLRFKELIQSLHRQFQQRVVILIDEYDKPMLDNIDKPELAISIREGLKNFYSVIKDSDAHIKFAFLTGVSKFSKVSLFSGLNNLQDITLDKHYATLCGYTQAEMQQVFAEYLEGVDMEQLRIWYNGYNFLGEKVYNPYDILLYLSQREYKSYWFETGSPSFLIKLVQQRQYNIPELEHIEASETMLSSFDVDRLEIETLLFQAGYLTIKSVRQQGSRLIYKLDYPNLEVKMSLTESLLSAFTRHPLQRERNLSAIYQALESGDLDLLKLTFQAFFASIPHDWYRKNQLAGYEGYYASIVYCYFAALGLEVIAEDCASQGQIDLTVKLGDKVFIIEFKVVEASSANGQALRQIKEKDYARKYRLDRNQVYLIGVEFDKNKRNIENFDWELT